MRNMFPVVFFILLLTLAAGAHTVEEVEISVLSSTLDETFLEITLPPIDGQNGLGDSLHLRGCEILSKEGFPSIPYVAGLVAVSDRGSFRGRAEIIDEYRVRLKESFPAIETLYPEVRFTLDDPQILRDYRIVRFQFFPLQYHPHTDEVSIARKVRIRIERDGPYGKNEKKMSREKESSVFSRIYKSSILNYRDVSRYPSDTVLYVIITPDAYYSDMETFKEWKEEMGIIVKLVKFTDISSNPTYYDIRNYMEDAYFNWPHPPDYFLAVGDAGVFPVKYTVDNAAYGTYADDNYYVALDSINDIFPDICGGRLPIQSSFHVQTLINKSINYECTPYMTETDWYRKAIMVSSDEYPSQPATKVWIRERLIEFGHDYVDSIYARNYYSSSPMQNDITNAVNQGRGFLNYRGPGWSSGWSASFGSIYSVSNVAALNNGRKLPVCTSLGCGVGKFDVSTCFAEQWMRNGTPTSEKGAVAFFSATWITHTRHNNKMDRGIYKGLLQEDLKSFGEGTVRGKMYMYNICGMSDTTITEMNEYLILGDPALLVRTDIPESMSVQHDTIVPIGESVLWVFVQDSEGPVPNAFVCARMDTIFHVSGCTDSTGSIGLTIFPTMVDSITVSVVSQNHFPYKGYCYVSASGPWLGYFDHFIDDDTLGSSSGNGDSIPSIGESIELPVVLKNYGSQDATAISAVLSTDDPCVTVTDSIESFGDLSAGDTALSQEDYDFSIATDVPDQHSVLFELIVNDTSGNEWESHFKVFISAPVLNVVQCLIDDAGQPNPNGILDPGETANMTIRLVNDGSITAEGVRGKIRSHDSYVECIDSTSTYGDIAVSQEKDGSPFIVTADSTTPIGYESELTLILNSSQGYYDSTTITLKIGVGGDFLVWDPDGNCSSGPKVRDALIASGYRGDYSTSISGYIDILTAYKAIFICLGVWPGNYRLNDGNIVDSLCNFLNEGGRLYMEGADTWAFDQPTSLHAYFHILGLQDGTSDTGPIAGVSSTFTNQMYFTYSGENDWMDHLGTTGGSFTVFNNVSPSYVNGIAYDGGGYKTVGTSFEFGGLVDATPPSTKEALADSIMRFFGVLATPEEKREDEYPTILTLSRNRPNPFNQRTRFTYTVPLLSGENPSVPHHVTIRVYSVSGRVVKTLVDEEKNPGVYTVSWRGTDDYGARVSQGVYFTRIKMRDSGVYRTRKVILLK
jgi:hypothetical protein